MTVLDPSFIQDAAFSINASCSKLQRIASTWRDSSRIDPMHVVIAARETAKALYAMADRIEAKRNAGLKLESAS